MGGWGGLGFEGLDWVGGRGLRLGESVGWEGEEGRRGWDMLDGRKFGMGWGGGRVLLVMGGFGVGSLGGGG